MLTNNHIQIHTKQNDNIFSHALRDKITPLLTVDVDTTTRKISIVFCLVRMIKNNAKLPYKPMNQHIAYHAAGIKTKQSTHPSTFRSRRVIPSRITFTMARNCRLGIIFVLQLTWSTVHISLVSSLSSHLILSSFRFHIQPDRYSVTIPHYIQSSSIAFS